MLLFPYKLFGFIFVETMRSGLDSLHDNQSELLLYDRVLWEIQSFLKSFTCDDWNDIPWFFSDILKFSNQLIDLQFESLEFDEIPMVSDDDTSYERKKKKRYDDLFGIFFNEIYTLEYDDCSIFLDKNAVFGEWIVQAQDISINSDTYNWSLAEIDQFENKDILFSSVKQAISLFTTKILRTVSEELRKREKAVHRVQQKMLEENMATIMNILEPSSGSLVSYVDPSIATEEDFVDTGFLSIANIVHEIYAEKPEYFANLFLWFDLEKGTFQTTEQKNDFFEKHWLETSEDGGFKYPQEILATWSLDSALPVLQNISSDLLAVMQDNISTDIQTDEQLVEQQIGYGLSFLPEKWNARIKDSILIKLQEQGDFTTEEKKQFVWKIYHRYSTWYSRRTIKIDINNLDKKSNSLVKDSLNALNTSINRSGDRHISRKSISATTLEGKQKELFLQRKEKLDQDVDMLAKRCFGEGFDLKATITSPEFQDSMKFYGKLFRSMFYSELLWFVLGVDCGFNAMLAKNFGIEYKNLYTQYYQDLKTMEDHFILIEDLSKFEDLNSKIKEVSNSSFCLDESALKPIFSSLLLRAFHQIYDGSEASYKHEFLAWTQRFKMYALSHDIDLWFIADAYQEVLSRTPSYFELKRFLELIKEQNLVVEYDIPHMTRLFQEAYEDKLYNKAHFYFGTIASLQEMEALAIEYSVPLKTTKSPIIEEYYIYRLRTPDTILSSQSKENWVDRYEGDTGYNKENLANISTLEETLWHLGSTLKRPDVLAMDMRDYRDIPRENWVDISRTVPVAVKFPKVHVDIHGNRNETGMMNWHYVLSYEPETHLCSLVFDDSFVNSDVLIEKYWFENQIILGGWFLTFNKEAGTVLVADRIHTYHHEPRLVTMTALKNTLNIYFPEFKLFIWSDWADRIVDYWW